MSMCILSVLLLSIGQVPVVESPDFTRAAQLSAVGATVRVRNPAQNIDGSGALIGKSGPFVYVLTAQHVVQGADGLEVAVFSESSYPNPKTVYRSPQVVAEWKGLPDLALLRIATTDALPGFVRACPEKDVPTNREFPGLTVGCDAGKAPTCLVEKVVGKKLVRRPEGSETAFFWELQRKQAAGRSGGPLLDRRGYLIGVCSGINRDKGYYTHITEVQTFLKRNGFRWLLEENTEP